MGCTKTIILIIRPECGKANFVSPDLRLCIQGGVSLSERLLCVVLGYINLQPISTWYNWMAGLDRSPRSPTKG